MKETPQGKIARREDSLLVVTQYFPPETTAGANRAYELSREWVTQGQSVCVLTGFPNHPDGIIPSEYRGRLRMTEAMDGIDVHRAPTYATPNRGYLRRILQHLTFLISTVLTGVFSLRGIKLVIASSPHLLVAVAGYLLSRLLRRPFVLEIRDLWPEAILAVGAMKRGFIISFLETVEVFLYRSAALIVVVTEGFKDKIAAKGIDRAKIVFIPNGVDLHRFNPEGDKAALKARNHFEGKFLVSYVGTHGMAQNLSVILEVAKQLESNPSIHFLFVGDGAERAMLEERARETGLSNVTFLGMQPKHTVPDFLRMSDVCLVPLRRTALFNTTIPSKIYEILASGTPLIVSVDGEARRLVERSGGGLYVEPEQVDAYVDALRSLLDPDRRAAMGAAGRSFVEREFGRQALAARYLSHLEDLLARSTNLAEIRP